MPQPPFHLHLWLGEPVCTSIDKIISYPRVRRGMIDLAAETIVAEVGYESLATLAEVETFLHAPAAWSTAHGGIAEFKPAR